jgi:hypothetical protein
VDLQTWGFCCDDAIETKCNYATSCGPNGEQYGPDGYTAQWYVLCSKFAAPPVYLTVKQWSLRRIVRHKNGL